MILLSENIFYVARLLGCAGERVYDISQHPVGDVVELLFSHCGKKMIMHYKSIEAPQAEQIHNTTKIGYKKTHLLVMSSKDI